MADTRRPRAATVQKRQRLLDAAERIMVREGYAAVTSRRVEAEAGMKLHYHFGTLDDLFVALVRRRGELNVELLAAALGSDEPLRAWWELASDARGATLLVELTAAGNHRAAVRSESAAIAGEVRRMQIAALEEILDDYGIDRDEFPPELVAVAIQGLAFAVSHDRAAGFDTSIDEATAAFERLLGRLEATRAAAVAERG